MHTNLLFIFFSILILASCSESDNEIQELESYQGISSVEDFWTTVESDDFNVNVSEQALQEIAQTLVFNGAGQLRGFTSEKVSQEMDDLTLSAFVEALLNTSNAFGLSNKKNIIKWGCEVVRLQTPILCWEQNNSIDFVENCCKKGTSLADVCIVPCFN